MGPPAYAVFTLEEVCLVLNGMRLGKVAENAPLAARGTAAVAENSVYLVLGYELMRRGDKLCVCVELHPKQKLAFERVEYLICVVVVEAQDAAVGSICREEVPILAQQRFALLMVGQHCCDSLSNIGKQAAFYAVKAGEKVAVLPIREVTVEVNHLLCQQFALRRGAALQLPLTRVLPGVEQLVDTPRGVTPGHKVHVALIASRIALGYAYPIRAHPCRVALSVHHNANTAVVDGWQERGYLVQ